MIPLLDRPAPHSSLAYLFKLGVEQTALLSREGRTAVDYALPPPSGLYSPPAPVPLPPFSLSAPSQSHGASGAQSPGPSPGIISSLLS